MGAGLGCYLARPGWPWDRAFFDGILRWGKDRLPEVSTKVAFLDIGADDLNGWSSTRQEYAAIASAIASLREHGASVIVLDLLLLRGEDADFQPFWNEVMGHPEVVLARTHEEMTRLPGPAANSGLALVDRDGDGAIRTYRLVNEYPSLALAAYLAMNGQVWKEGLKVRLPDGRGGWLEKELPPRIVLKPRSLWSERGPRAFSHFRLSDLKRKDLSLEGKCVFVSYAAAGSTDLGANSLEASTPKVAIHAWALNDLLQNQFCRALNPGPQGLAGSLLFGLGWLVGWWPGLLVLLAMGSHQSLWGRVVCPWASWVLCYGLGLGLRWYLQHRRWKSMQARSDGKDPMFLRRLGSYVLLEKLGQGGFGAVYRAVPEGSLDESEAVAVKVAQNENDEFRRRFLREARISRSLRHPHIVRVLESGEDGDSLFYTMEWLRGVSLRQWMDERGAVAPEVAEPILRALVEAMSYAHGRQVLHRDLKPENVMMEATGPKVVDFGLAFDTESSKLTASMDVMGTLNYLAPERIQGNSYDARSDQYALGVMGYELLAGKSPFPNSLSAGEVLMWRLTQDPPPLEQRGRLAERVEKMMARDPAQRFESLEVCLSSWG